MRRFYNGHEYVSPYDELDASFKNLEKGLGSKLEPLEELRRIASAAESRARLAEQEAAAARKDARFSKVVSILSLVVSIGSLVLSAVALALR